MSTPRSVAENVFTSSTDFNIRQFILQNHRTVSGTVAVSPRNQVLFMFVNSFPPTAYPGAHTPEGCTRHRRGTARAILVHWSSHGRSYTRMPLSPRVSYIRLARCWDHTCNRTRIFTTILPPPPKKNPRTRHRRHSIKYLHFIGQFSRDVGSKMFLCIRSPQRPPVWCVFTDFVHILYYYHRSEGSCAHFLSFLSRFANRGIFPWL